MAYKQNNNPLKKINEGLQSFGERHTEWKAKRAEMPQKKYGHFSEGAKAYRAGKKSGESKFQYDIRMRKEGRKASSTKPGSTFTPPDPKSEMSIAGADRPSWEYNPSDLRAPEVISSAGVEFTDLPSEKGDPFEYRIADLHGRLGQSRNIEYRDTRKSGADWEYAEEGSAHEKAIRERYTGSETGDFQAWIDNPWKSKMYSSQTIKNIDMEESKIYSEGQEDPGFESHLTYEQMQKYNNPSYKKK